MSLLVFKTEIFQPSTIFGFVEFKIDIIIIYRHLGIKVLHFIIKITTLL